MDLRRLKDKATEAFSKGKFAKAAELYEAYCTADPKDLQARLRMGDAWAKAGGKTAREKAIDAYKSAAEGFAKEGFLPRAIAASKLILELDPAHKGVQQMLAGLYASRGGPPKSGPRKTGLDLPAVNVATEAKGKFAPIDLPPDTSGSTEPLVEQKALPPAPAVPPPARTSSRELELPPEPKKPVEPPRPQDGLELDSELELDAPAPAPRKAAAALELDGEIDLEAAAREAAAALESGGDDDDSGVDLSMDGGTPGGEELAAEGAAPDHSSELPPELDLDLVSSSSGPPSATPSNGAPGAGGPPGLRRRPTGEFPAVAAPTSELSAEAEGDDDFIVELTVKKNVAAPADANAVEPLPPTPAAAPAAAPATVSPFPTARNSRIWLPGASDTAPTPAPAHRPEMARAGYTAAPTNAETGRKREIERTLAAFSAFDELDLDMISQGEPPLELPPRPATPPAVSPQPPEPAQVAAEAAPDTASIRVPTFTELELEGDSLLHAVEMAALAGLSQRGDTSGAPAEDSMSGMTDDGQGSDAQLSGGLPKIPLFSDLPADAFIELFERCPLKRYGMGERIIEQGSVGDAFYVICAGTVRVVREDNGQSRDLATLPEGSFFGEMALLSGAPRTASVDSANEETQLLEISATVLAHLSHRYPQVAQALKKFCRQRLLSNVMNTAPLFQPFAKKERKSIIERFRARDVKKGDTIIREGVQTDGLYVLLSGEVEVRKEAKVLARLKEGDVFGEMSLLKKTPASATVSATKRTSLLRLPRTDFDNVVKSHPQILQHIAELSEDRRRATEAVLGGAAVEGEDGLMLV